ncbi:hypothetical protein V8E36_006587 [Tilletia maclaganii]
MTHDHAFHAHDPPPPHAFNSRTLAAPSSMHELDLSLYGRHSATLPRHGFGPHATEEDSSAMLDGGAAAHAHHDGEAMAAAAAAAAAAARLRSQSSGPEFFLSGSVKRRPANAAMLAKKRTAPALKKSVLGGVDQDAMMPELLSIDGDAKSISKFTSFKASSRAIGIKLKSMFVSKNKSKLDEADSRRGSSDYDTTNSSSGGNTTASTTRLNHNNHNISFGRSGLSRWNYYGDSQRSNKKEGQIQSPLRQLFDPFEGPNPIGGDGAEDGQATMPIPYGETMQGRRPSLAPSSTAPPSTLLTIPSSASSQARTSSDQSQHPKLRTSPGRKTANRGLRALASFSRLRDGSSAASLGAGRTPAAPSLAHASPQEQDRAVVGFPSRAGTAVKRTIDEVMLMPPASPSLSAVAFPTPTDGLESGRSSALSYSKSHLHHHQQSSPHSPASSRHRRRSRTGSDAAAAASAARHRRHRVPSRAPPAILPPIPDDVRTFRICERDSWIHVEDAGGSSAPSVAGVSDGGAASQTHQQQQHAWRVLDVGELGGGGASGGWKVGSPLLLPSQESQQTQALSHLHQQQQQRGRQASSPSLSTKSPRLPTFSFTPPVPALMETHKGSMLPYLPSPSASCAPSPSPGGRFRFSATPSSVILPLNSGIPFTIPSVKVSTASEIGAGDRLQQRDGGRVNLMGGGGGASSSMVPTSATGFREEDFLLRHQSSRDSLPFPPRAKRHRSTTVSSRASSLYISGGGGGGGASLSSAGPSPAAHKGPSTEGGGSSKTASPSQLTLQQGSEEHTMTSLRTVSSSILYFGADLTPSKARPASMMLEGGPSGSDGGAGAGAGAAAGSGLGVKLNDQEEVMDSLRRKLGLLDSKSKQGPSSGAGRTVMAPTSKPESPLPPLPTTALSTPEIRGPHEDEDGIDDGAVEEVGDNTLTDTPGPSTLSRGVCGTSLGQHHAGGRQGNKRVLGSGESIASILSYVSTVVSSTESDDVQSLVDGISVDGPIGHTAADKAKEPAQNNEIGAAGLLHPGGMQQRERLNASSASDASSAFSTFELSAALAVSNLPRARVCSVPGPNADASSRANQDGAASKMMARKDESSGSGRMGGALKGEDDDASTSGTATLRDALTLRFPLPKPMKHPGQQAPHLPGGYIPKAGPSSMKSSSNYYPPTSYSRHIPPAGSSMLAAGSGDSEETLTTDAQMLKRISEGGQSHQSHLSLVLAHLEESPCPPPRRRPVPKILGPSHQGNL